MCDAQDTAEAQAAALHADLDPLLLFTKDLNNYEVENYWMVQLPVGLLFEMWRVQAELAAAARRANIPKLALLCRNALELHVWAKYVASSLLAAKRFHQDAYVDGLEVFKVLERVFQALDKEWLPVVRAATDPLMPEFERVLKRDKVGLSIDELRTMRHLNIAHTAAQVGYGEVFALWNPILSKLVHATAFNVLVAGKSMEGVGLFLVRGIAQELRAGVEAVEVYLRSNNLPQYSSR
jgi:hypothetical protein